MKNKKNAFNILVITISLVIIGIVSIGLGAVKISPVEVVQTLYAGLTGNAVDGSNHTIIFKIRLPRILLATLLGMTLAGAGVIFQACFKNPMADPYILGISSGAALGASLVIVFGGSVVGGAFGMISAGAFIGALLTVLVVFRLAGKSGKVNNLTLLLSGIAINFMLSAMVSLIMTINREHLEQITFWTLGGVNAASWDKVLLMLPVVVIMFIMLKVYARDLDLLLLGDDSALSLGVRVEKTRKILLGVASLATAAAVASCGIVGFVGLIIPHSARMISGPNHKYLAGYAMLLGGAFTIMSDTVARTVIAPGEIPLGVMTAVLGAPYFLYLLRRNTSQPF